jgi:eukaryotic-like serine/threonine-protein kinase
MDNERLLENRYRLGALLGRGGAADVYEARAVHGGRPVAVKVFRSGGDVADRTRFAAEAELLAGLSHPRLVPVHDVRLGADPPYLVMRLIPGGTMRDSIERGPLSPARVAELGAQLTDALAHIHARGVIHRDIKPSNVLIGADGACYLTDFGIAKVMGTVDRTGSNELIGTARYLAPEQVRGEGTGPAVDVYALGLVMLECLTGRPEYTGTDVEIALARLSRPPRVPEALPVRWRTLLTAMTATDASQRPTARECAPRLRAIARGLPAETLPAPEPRPTAPEPTVTIALPGLR